MGLGGKVAYGVDGILAEGAPDGGGVADVALDEHVALTELGGDVVEASRVARVCEGVEVDDAAPEAGLLEDVADEVRADEPGAAGHHEVFESCLFHNCVPAIIPFPVFVW